MAFCSSKTVAGSLADVEARTRAALKDQGFGVLTEIDVEETLRTKIGAEVGPYRILGACNPKMAKGAIDLEPRIGVMLPCNVILRGAGDGRVEVSAVDPVASMAGIPNEALKAHAGQVRERLFAALEKV